MTEQKSNVLDLYDKAPPQGEKQAPPPGKAFNSDFFKVAYCVVGILGSFLAYGVLQERIMTQSYGETEEMFTYSAFLVLNNRSFAIITAICMLLYKQESLRNVAPLSRYFFISFSNVSATYCQYEALKYVSFPTQTLGKCGKMIPVLILGKFILGKQYNWKDYTIAACVTLGCTAFVLTGDISDKKSNDDSFFGLMLMGGYLFFDGFTSTFQEKLFKGFQMSTYNQMLYVNCFSGFTSLMILIMAKQLFPAIAFAGAHPDFFMQACGLSMCAVMGQMTIYYTIKTFGALLYSTIMTTRQVISIILSSVLFLHNLSVSQWISAFVVFGALYYKARMKKGKSPAPAADANKVNVVTDKPTPGK